MAVFCPTGSYKAPFLSQPLSTVLSVSSIIYLSSSEEPADAAIYFLVCVFCLCPVPTLKKSWSPVPGSRGS